MAGKKRKATTDIANPVARRQSRRVAKAKVVYKESEPEDVESDDEFNEDEAVRSEEDSEQDEEPADDDNGNGNSDDDELDDFEKDLKKKGYVRKKGKGGKYEMVIELPQEKDDGGVSYEDGRIHSNTLEFLKDLKKNNNREWLKFHDAPFRSEFLLHEEVLCL
jgi:hypothetical protein